MNFFLDLPLVHTYIYLLHEQLILKAHIDKLLHLSMHWFNVCRFYRLSTNFVNVCRWSFFHICRWFLTFVSKIFHVSTFVDVLTFVVSSHAPCLTNIICVILQEIREVLGLRFAFDGIVYITVPSKVLA